MDSNERDRLKGVNKDLIYAKAIEIKESQPIEVLQKYSGVCGIYGIWINDKLVYIGSSKDVLLRWCFHQTHTFYDFGQHDYKEKKYEILREAKSAGCRVSFNLLEKCKEGALRILEVRYINQYKPVLNQEFTSNRLDDNITLKDILG